MSSDYDVSDDEGEYYEYDDEDEVMLDVEDGQCTRRKPPPPYQCAMLTYMALLARVSF